MVFYQRKFSIQPFVVATVLLAPAFNIGSASANEVVSNTTQSVGNVTSTVEKIDANKLAQPSTVQDLKTSQNVTSVSQLSDVRPTDWAFTALQSLVERYGCIAGYPDRTYRGQRALSRYEFAAGLNACLDKINEIISAGLADKVSKEDLAALQKLQEEFAAELATLRGRVDALEAKTAKLEAQQFSTTTKLNATVIFAFADTWGGTGTGTAAQNPQKTTDRTNATLSYRVRLNFDTSFTGKDLLRTRLQAGNIPNLGAATATNTNMARLAFATDTLGAFELDKLYYRFPIGDNLTAFLGANALDPDDVGDTLNPYFESSDKGALSRFGRYDPLIFRGPSGAGLGLVYKFNPQFSIVASYLARTDSSTTTTPTNTAASATGQGGLFNGGYMANVQLIFAPSKDFKIGLAYARSFEPGTIVNVSSSTGSTFGSRPFGAVDTSSDRYGAQFNWQVSKGFNFGGWIGFANAQQQSGGSNNASLFNWSVNLAFPDLFAEGNRGGIIFGQPPKVTSNSIGANVDPSTSYLLELQYGFRVSKNITITPGIIAIFNPNHNDANPTTWVGTIKTLFTF
ncbi:iron uptake porin [Tumidithrix elongata RA019]|uniref:Iron uptake porin n=1 Tax=Tumidithrix elongata BACA0141 TaxID=2716417 RepID=A0AAW9Q2S2_9CYAN|nr:iron uptake porin [Tumidithrix elongata RA019]